jgi:hypothetical protein
LRSSGVAYYRMNVVHLRDDPPRPDALGAAESYVPSIVEWGIRSA